MSKKKKTHHDQLLFAFKITDTYDFEDPDVIHESPWYDSEEEANAALRKFTKENDIGDDGFYSIRIITMPKTN